MRSAAPIRLAIVLSHPTQYYSPWFRWLKAHTTIEFRVFYLWEFGVSARRDPQFKTVFAWDVDLLSGYESEFVPNVARSPGAESFWGFNNPSLAGRLAAWRPDALLIFGYKWLTHVRTIGWARRRGVPLIFRGDSHFLGRPDPGWRRTLPLRWLFRRFAAVTYVGAPNRAYFEKLGVPPRKLFFAPHAVNRELFDPANPGHRAAAAALRAELGIGPGTRVVLFAGKLLQAKQPRALLEAFLKADAAYAGRGQVEFSAVGQPDRTKLDLTPSAAEKRDGNIASTFSFVFVGEGDEKARLQEIARGAPAGSVHFLPFANQSEMPSRYLLADIFALPSRGLYETWGLAVNEAMHMGVPCLVSDRVGCQQDLVTDGQTGWVFRADDPGTLQDKLGVAMAAVADDAGREKLRAAVLGRISGYTYEQTTNGLLAAIGSLGAQMP